MNLALKSDYDSKLEFCNDVLRMCRTLKKEYLMFKSHRTPYFYNKFVSVGGEYWKFSFYISDVVKTECIYYGKNEIKYPLTTWGDRYSRWDSELKAFLMREILKED